VRGGVAKSWLFSFSDTELLGDGNSEGENRGECSGLSVLWVA
jgi:hypothetical protein